MTEPNSPNKHLLSNRVEPSAEGFSPVLHSAYGSMNAAIAADRLLYANNFQADHLDYSHENIYATAQVALARSVTGEERNALILGAGGCGDIPLIDIVSEFDKTVLVDADISQTELALNALPFDLLGKVSLVRADISGVAKDFDRAFGQAATTTSYQHFVQQAAAMVREIDVTKNRLDLGEKFSFVCSQLLMSQLASLPIMHLGPLSAGKFGRQFEMNPDGEAAALVLALDDQNASLQFGHIDHLRRLVRDNGTVHFADTMVEFVDDKKILMMQKPIIGHIDEAFDHVCPAMTWRYDVSPSQAFQVGSFALAPKLTIDSK